MNHTSKAIFWQGKDYCGYLCGQKWFFCCRCCVIEKKCFPKNASFQPKKHRKLNFLAENHRKRRKLRPPDSRVPAVPPRIQKTLFSDHTKIGSVFADKSRYSRQQQSGHALPARAVTYSKLAFEIFKHAYDRISERSVRSEIHDALKNLCACGHESG